MARTITVIIDPLTHSERVRIEALRLAIAMQPGRYPMIADYVRDAETVENWIKAANPVEPAPIPPVEAYEAEQGAGDTDFDIHRKYV